MNASEGEVMLKYADFIKYTQSKASMTYIRSIMKEKLC